MTTAIIPPKTLELTKKLVEEDKVLFTFAGLGTDPMAAVQPYLNANKVPQLFIASGATMWDKPREFPWTTGFQPSYQTEGHIHAEYLLENHPRSKIAILYQDDAFGRDAVKGLKDGLGGKIPIVAEATYKVSDASIDAQIAKLRASGADIFYDIDDAEIRRDGDQAHGRDRLEAGAHHLLGVALAPGGAAAGRAAATRKACCRRPTRSKATIRRWPTTRPIANTMSSSIATCRRRQGQSADHLRLRHRADHGRGA